MKNPSVTRVPEVDVVVERRTEAVAGEMPPSLGREARGVSAAAVTPEAVIRVRSISSRKILVTAATARGRSARKPRSQGDSHHGSRSFKGSNASSAKA